MPDRPRRARCADRRARRDPPPGDDPGRRCLRRGRPGAGPRRARPTGVDRRLDAAPAARTSNDRSRRASGRSPVGRAPPGTTAGGPSDAPARSRDRATVRPSAPLRRDHGAGLDPPSDGPPSRPGIANGARRHAAGVPDRRRGEAARPRGRTALGAGQLDGRRRCRRAGPPDRAVRRGTAPRRRALRAGRPAPAPRPMPRRTPCEPRSATYDEHESAAARRRGGPIRGRSARPRTTPRRRFRAAAGAATSPDAVEAAARDWLQRDQPDQRRGPRARARRSRRERAAAAADRRDPRAPRPRGRLRPGSAPRPPTRPASRRGRRSPTATSDAAAAARSAVQPAADRRRDTATAVDAGSTRTRRSGSALRGRRRRRASSGCCAATGQAMTDAGREPRRRRPRRPAPLAARDDRDLVDAILADAIEASALDFPHDHPFWGPFTQAQSRDIASALSSLGYRFDGLGGWVDERYPVAARPVARAGLRGARPDADPPLADRGRDRRPVPRGRRSRPTSTSPARPAT